MVGMRFAFLLLFGCAQEIQRAPSAGDGCDRLTDAEAASEVVAAVNAARSAAGLVALGEDEALAAAAASHAAYLYAHRDGDEHLEDPAREGFTGQAPWERALAAGYAEAEVSESVHYLGDPEETVAAWLDAVYPRARLLDPAARDVGFGRVCAGDLQVDVALVGHWPDETAQAIAAWPADGASEVPLTYEGLEAPDPLPGAAYPLGYPLSVHPHRGLEASLVGVEVTDGAGVAFDLVVLTPQDDPAGILESAIYALPTAPIPQGTAVRWRVALDVGGREEIVEGAFTAR